MLKSNLGLVMANSRDPKNVSDKKMLARVIRLAFDGDELCFREFCARLKAGLPPGTGVVLRGSVVTNKRWKEGGPFDEKGRGTSDLDVTLVGNDVMEFWNNDAYYIPGLHTKPLCDEDPEIAPKLNTLREELQEFSGRPVNFQATANIVLYVRDVLFDEPYITVIEEEKRP